MRKLLAWTLISLMLLSACQTAPTVQVVPICPQIPPLEQTPAALVPSFTGRMQSFLAGKLPEPSDLLVSLPNAKLPTVEP